MTIREFIDKGYLQEANRCFFHPLGLALVIEDESDLDRDVSGFLIVLSDPDDPEGFIYDPSLLTPEFRARAENIANEFIKRAGARIQKMGEIIQSPPGGSVAKEWEE